LCLLTPLSKLIYWRNEKFLHGMHILKIVTKDLANIMMNLRGPTFLSINSRWNSLKERFQKTNNSFCNTASSSLKRTWECVSFEIIEINSNIDHCQLTNWTIKARSAISIIYCCGFGYQHLIDVWVWTFSSVQGCCLQWNEMWTYGKYQDELLLCYLRMWIGWHMEGGLRVWVRMWLWWGGIEGSMYKYSCNYNL